MRVNSPIAVTTHPARSWEPGAPSWAFRPGPDFLGIRETAQAIFCEIGTLTVRTGVQFRSNSSEYPDGWSIPARKALEHRSTQFLALLAGVTDMVVMDRSESVTVRVGDRLATMRLREQYREPSGDINIRSVRPEVAVKNEASLPPSATVRFCSPEV